MLPRFLHLRVPSFLVAVLATVLAAVPARADMAVGAAAPFDPAKIHAVRDQVGVAAADDGTVTLFAWVDRRSGNADVYAARVEHDGTVLDPNGIPVAVTGQDELEPTVSWNGSEWLVAWTRGPGDGVYAARIATDGELLDPSAITISNSPFTPHSPSAAGLGTGHAIVWTQSDLDHTTLGAIVASDGSFDVPPQVLSLGAGPLHVSPRIAVLGATALCAFVDDGGADPAIKAFRFERSTSGPPALVRLDATDLVVSPGGVREESPAVAASAGGWLVAWADGRNSGVSGVDIWAARVSPAGALLDASGIEVSDDTGGKESAPAVTHTGTEWLVTWSQGAAGQFLRAVANNGNASATRIDVSTSPDAAGRGAFGGATATPIVAWSDPEPGPPTQPQDLLGRVVAADLSLGDAFPIATQTPNQTQPAMSFGANRWFVAWVDDRFGPTEGQLRYAVSDGPEFTAPAPASIGWVAPRPGLDQAQPTACFDGTNFNVFWTEERGGHRRIVGARFTPGGAFLDTVTVAAGAWDHVEPAAIHHRWGTVTVAWTDARVPADRDVWGQQVRNGALTGSELLLSGTPGVNDEKPRFGARVVDRGENWAVLVWQKRGAPGTGSIFARYIFTDSFQSSGTEELVREEAGHVFESPQVAWNGYQYVVTYQEFVANDGPGLYIPWATWLNGPFSFVSFSIQLGPGSYVPANPIAGSAGYNFVTLRSRLSGSQVDLDIRRANATPGFPDAAPIPYTNDPAVDVPGAAHQGQGDRVGLLHLRQQNDADWVGLRLFGAEARDTLEGKVVINEFSANPSSGNEEFYELYNPTGQSFELQGWFIAVNGDSGDVAPCIIFLSRKGQGDVVQGTICGELPSGNYYGNTDFTGIAAGSPAEGYLPNRGGLIELFTPGGVKVDQVGYGFRGGAPVSPAIPAAQAPALRAGGGPLAAESAGGAGSIIAAVGDSVTVSTARLPDGTDTNNDANDFNLTTNTTSGTSNLGTASALGSSLFVTRGFWNPPSGPDALELFNPGTTSVDFSGWYLGSNDGTQRIGVDNNAWSVLESLDKRVLRRGERGSFTTDLDYLTVVYLLDPNFARVEQLGWSRPDNQQPQQCMTREPDTGGFHDGFDWFTSGGEQNLFAGQLRYVTCDISSPDASVDTDPPVAALAFRGAVPNPLPAAGGALVFTVPGARGASAVPVRLRLVDVAGRVRATLVDGALAPGEHRIALSGAGSGLYYAELEIAGQRRSRPVVVLP